MLLKIEFTPPDGQTGQLIGESLVMVRNGSRVRDAYQILVDKLGYNYMLELALFSDGEIVRGVDAVDISDHLIVRFAAEVDEAATRSFMSTFGTYLLDVGCQLIDMTAIVEGRTLLGHVESDYGEHVTVIESHELEHYVQADAQWVDTERYPKIGDAYRSLNEYGCHFGFDDELYFFIYGPNPPRLITPVKSDPTHWTGVFCVSGQEVVYTVRLLHVGPSTPTKLQFLCGDFELTAQPPLLLVPNGEDEFKQMHIECVHPWSDSFDAEISRALAQVLSH